MTYPCPEKASSPVSPLVRGETFLREIYPTPGRSTPVVALLLFSVHLSGDLAGLQEAERGHGAEESLLVTHSHN